MNKIFKVGLIGCGHISETYFRAEKYFNNIKIVKCADINLINAKKCAQINKIKATTVKKLLEDKKIEIILNLTIPKAHYQVAKQALTNGKHVYSEKPLAINFKDGQELLKLSKKKKLYIGNAPDTFLGGGIQKSKELIDKKNDWKNQFRKRYFCLSRSSVLPSEPRTMVCKKRRWPCNRYGSLLSNSVSKFNRTCKKSNR
ncbi:Gfo/Idh/MocA family oxidoreductase [Candidatus Pelagibacter sp.]|nr:Gfo/Idh/MocA family oxidoreductase [Candidatus Pelagibacter sp.]